jgi:hypothetical protein
LIVTIRRSPSSLKEVGTNVAVTWKPDSSVIAVSVSFQDVTKMGILRHQSVFRWRGSGECQGSWGRVTIFQHSKRGG